MSKQKITVIPGDGIGPEITKATLRVLDALDCNLDYDMQLAGLTAIEAGKELIPAETLESIRKNSIALKGPLTTPIGKGFTSLNVMLRKEFDLYANVRPAITRKGIDSRYEGIDLITVRENTEGMYSQEKQSVSEDGERAESLSVITREGASRILKFAYDLAKRQGRKNVAVVHKANILKATSGLFLEVSRDIREDYPEIETSEFKYRTCPHPLTSGLAHKLITILFAFPVVRFFGSLFSRMFVRRTPCHVAVLSDIL